MFQFMGFWSSGKIGYFKEMTVSLSDYNFQFDHTIPKYNYFFKGLIEYHCMVPKALFEEFYKDNYKNEKEKLKTVFTAIKFYQNSGEIFFYL